MNKARPDEMTAAARRYPAGVPAVSGGGERRTDREEENKEINGEVCMHEEPWKEREG